MASAKAAHAPPLPGSKCKKHHGLAWRSLPPVSSRNHRADLQADHTLASPPKLPSPLLYQQLMSQWAHAEAPFHTLTPKRQNPTFQHHIEAVCHIYSMPVAPRACRHATPPPQHLPALPSLHPPCHQPQHPLNASVPRPCPRLRLYGPHRPRQPRPPHLRHQLPASLS